MSKFTAAQLVEFYQKVVDGGVIEVSNMDGSWHTTTTLGPSLAGDNNVWRIKPAKKIIDMAHLVKSGIDCEFRDEGDWLKGGAPLTKIQEGAEEPYISHSVSFMHCQPRMNHKMYHDGGECPLPEGFEVEVYYRMFGKKDTGPSHRFNWKHIYGDPNIIGYKILRKLDGWAYTWES